MSKGNSGHFQGTSGSKAVSSSPAHRLTKSSKAPPLFRNGHITYRGIAAHRERFLGKNVHQVAKLLIKQGYEVTIKSSKRETSKAKIIVTNNPSKERNITQVQISPGSKRHGNIPYVKISTTDKGKIKIIDGKRKDYNTDGKETARLYFRRYRRRK